VDGFSRRCTRSFSQGEAKPFGFFVPSLPVIAIWLLDAWYFRRERLFRRLFGHVRTENGPPDFSMDVRPLSPAKSGQCSPLPCHRRSSAFYGPVLLAVILLALFPSSIIRYERRS
jgi:hypothetical protein